MKNNLNNKFYRNNNPRLFRLLWLMVFVNLVLVVALVYLVSRPPHVDYFASVDGKNTHLISLEAPIVTQASLLQWATQAVVTVYTYDFLNYAKNFADAEGYFTAAGWTQFQNSNQKNLDEVKKSKLRVTAVATGAPVITDQGPFLGHYIWRVSIPMLVTYESPNKVERQGLLVNLLIMRIDTRIDPKGIAISQFHAAERAAQR